MSETMVQIESLTSLKLQVDRDGQVHSFTDTNSMWKFVDPISVVDLVEKYNDLLQETGEVLTSLKLQVDRDGQVHSFTDTNSMWKFENPIPAIDLVEKYKDVLANVAIEHSHALPKGSRDRFHNRNWPF